MLALGSARHAMYRRRHPKKVYKTNAHLLTTFWEMRFGTMSPSAVDRTVMTASAPSAPARMMTRGCRMAIMAAMMKVSSPSSETRIMEMELRNASLNPPSPPLSTNGSPRPPAWRRSALSVPRPPRGWWRPPSRKPTDERAASATRNVASTAAHSARVVSQRAVSRLAIVASGKQWPPRWFKLG